MKAALIVRRQPPREVALSLTSRSRPQSIAPVYISGDTICPPRRAGPCLPNFLQLSSLSKQGFQSWKGSETHTNDGARRARRAISKFIWLRGEALGVLSALGSEVSQPPPPARAAAPGTGGAVPGDWEHWELLGLFGAFPLGCFGPSNPARAPPASCGPPAFPRLGRFLFCPFQRGHGGSWQGNAHAASCESTRGHRSQRLGCWAWVADALRRLVSPQPVNVVFFTKPFSRTFELRLSCRK